MRTVMGVTFILACSVPVSFAASMGEDDPIAAQLLKDKEAFLASLAKSKEAVLTAFDKSYETVKNNKSLKIETQIAQLEQIETEKKLFDESGLFPTLGSMKTAIADFRTVQKKAESQCKAAFEKAAKAYRDKGDVKMAAAAIEEMKEFMAKNPIAAGNAATVIACAVSNKVFGLMNGSTEDGTKVVTADYVKRDLTQLWRVVPAGDGWAYVENLKSGLLLTAHGKGNGTDVIVSKKVEGSDDQLWKVSQVPNMKDGVRLSAKPSGKVLGVEGKSKNAGTRIILWQEEKAEASQVFGLVSPK